MTTIYVTESLLEIFLSRGIFILFSVGRFMPCLIREQGGFFHENESREGKRIEVKWTLNL
jgi:hypothetical protein